MGFRVSCEGCGRVALGVMTSLRNVNGRYLCSQCAENPEAVPKYYCTSCLRESPTAFRKGIGWVEVVLYIFYIIPGVIYSVWRRWGEPDVCPICKTRSLVPISEKQNVTRPQPSTPAPTSTTGRTQYNVYEHPNNRFEAVKQGWSWPALFFVWIWALFRGMWVIGIGTGIAVFALDMALIRLTSDVDYAFIWFLGILLRIGVGFWFGMHGNKWREKNLLSRGYRLVGQVKSATSEGAIANCRSGRETVREAEPKTEREKPVVSPVGKPAEVEPQLEIIEEPIQPPIRVCCDKCGLDKQVPRSKFGERTGAVRVKCPKCKESIIVNLN